MNAPLTRDRCPSGVDVQPAACHTDAAFKALTTWDETGRTEAEQGLMSALHPLLFISLPHTCCMCVPASTGPPVGGFAAVLL